MGGSARLIMVILLLLVGQGQPGYGSFVCSINSFSCLCCLCCLPCCYLASVGVRLLRLPVIETLSSKCGPLFYMLVNRWVWLHPIGSVRTCIRSRDFGVLLVLSTCLLISNSKRLFSTCQFSISDLAPAEGTLQIVRPYRCVFDLGPHGQLFISRGTSVLPI